METKHQIPIAVIGCAIYAPDAPPPQSLEEALYHTTQTALKDAGLEMSDIDGIVVAGNDLLDGRAITIMAASGSVGGVGRDIMSTPSASEHAFILGALRTASGQYNTQLVIAWSPLEVDSIANAQHLSTDPYFHRQLPLDDLAAYALQANSLESRMGDLKQLVRDIAVDSRRQGLTAYPEHASVAIKKANENLVRWPITRNMIAPPAFGVVAMVLATERFISEHKPKAVAWLHGMGWATETGLLGDRDLARLESLTAAAQDAYQQAGVSDPLTEFDVAEVSDPTPYQRILACEGLGLWSAEELKRSSKAAVSEKTQPAINPSGGSLTYNPLFCTGLMRIAQAAEQVRHRCGRHQLSDVARAVAHAASGFAMQYNAVVVFGENRRETQQ